MSAVDLDCLVRRLRIAGVRALAHCQSLENEAADAITALRRAPVSAGKVMALSDAYEAGARAVHQKWLRAHKAGEGPSRGDPEFGEAATDYAAFAAVYAQALKDQGETRAKLVQAETALAALQPGDGWQDISSAPKDGTEFQAWTEDDRGQRNWEPRCRINPDTGAFEIWDRIDYDADGWDTYSTITLGGWMPQPAPPASLPQGEETR